MNGWAVTQIVLMGIGCGVELARHGQPKTGKHSLWIALTAAAIQGVILYKAGLFN